MSTVLQFAFLLSMFGGALFVAKVAKDFALQSNPEMCAQETFKDDCARLGLK